MIYKKFILLSLFFIIFSCSNVDFVYKNENGLKNPLYEKTLSSISGQSIPAIYTHFSKIFGLTKSEVFELKIYIEENKIRRVVQNNQAVSKLDYELKFNYYLFNIAGGCQVYSDVIISRFSYVPKSSGYNFSSDKSLDKLYERAVIKNFEEFIGSVSRNNISSC